jgi:hypothetical protein
MNIAVDMKKKYLYSILAAAFLAVVAVIFFAPDDIAGNVLQQHDIMQGTANGQEGKAFHEATGETTRWTDSLFGGMPNFQIAPSYPANGILSWLSQAFMLWLPQPAGLLFLMMAGFFVMCLCMKMKWHTALFASVAWGFSTYFIILIGAGHIWKFTTLAYIPPTIGGIILLYRGKYLPGTAMTALFGALQLQSNHPQMTYYFLFVIFALVIGWLYKAIKEKSTAKWGIATSLMILSGAFALAANSASLYNTYEYSKETVRGKATDLTAAKGDETGGMNRSAITAWSYGVDETFTLLVPNVKGGATIQPVQGQTQLKSLAETTKAQELNIAPEEYQFLGQFPQYFGNQPMTNGPVYVGAFVLVLAILALFLVEGPTKWALLAVSILSILLSWGHNFPALTDFFIDHFPAYNKFRAVSSILVVVEFTIPLLAAMCISKMVDDPERFRKNRVTMYVVAGLGALICLVGWLAPSVFGEPFSASELQQLGEAGAFTDPMYSGVISAIRDTRLSLVSGDALRSLIFILLGCGVVFLYLKGTFKNKSLFVCSLTLLVLVDLYSVNKRYVNHDNFTTPVENETAFNMTEADKAILRDTTNYRVLDVKGMGDARSSYFHKTIGGYHAAKLTRYNDLLEHQIYKSNPAVINMLNAKYILNGEMYDVNPGALGNAWWVSRLDYVANADEEMAALDSLDTRTDAVADRKFEAVLGKAGAKAVGDTIFETSYAPNRLTYKANSAHGGVAVFSEIYFPWGWNAEIDGKPAEIGRANYVLRALRIPAGEHNISFTFDPQSLRVTNAISVVAVVIIYLICAAALGLFIYRTVKKKDEPEVGE